MKIREATNRDLDAVETLLSANDLPLDGVKENFSSFVVAEDKGKIAGAIGLEKFGSVALLRSAVPAAVKASAEFQGACPDSAVVMTRRVMSRAKASA